LPWFACQAAGGPEKMPAAASQFEQPLRIRTNLRVFVAHFVAISGIDVLKSGAQL